jgi:CDP-diacylglycerol--inositol 3-phosphatidyltransferase
MILSPTSFILSSVLYLSSFIGDLFDGMVARKYNQTSTFGGLMDMVTDRCSTTGLLCVLIREFADKSGFVLVSMVVLVVHTLFEIQVNCICLNVYHILFHLNQLQLALTLEH